MYLSEKTYKKPLDENAWYAQKCLINGKYRYFIFRRIRGKKERIYVGNLKDLERIETLIKAYEKKLGLPNNLKTKFTDFILIKVEPVQGKIIKTRQEVNPGKTNWYGRVLKNGYSYPTYLYRKIYRKTHRFYLGTDPNENMIKEKIAEYETKIDLDPKYRTDLEKFKLKIKKE